MRVIGQPAWAVSFLLGVLKMATINRGLETSAMVAGNEVIK